jgi:hypothetical protein
LNACRRRMPYVSIPVGRANYKQLHLQSSLQFR